ncbi:MAG: hypothetical protein OEZ06_01230 [Myxococcales bacterium]|nr:hypothetical protein [Myxococcales bacterium]
MNKLLLILFCAVALAACSSDTDPGGSGDLKGTVDIKQLTAGDWPVSVSDGVSTVEVPFSNAVPESALAAEVDPGAEIAGAVFLNVKSDETGATANLTDGELVDGDPTGPGEFTWELNDARDLATLTFWNATGEGLTLKTDRTYTAQIAITKNDFIDTLLATNVTLQPE